MNIINTHYKKVAGTDKHWMKSLEYPYHNLLLAKNVHFGGKVHMNTIF